MSLTVSTTSLSPWIGSNRTNLLPLPSLSLVESFNEWWYYELRNEYTQIAYRSSRFSSLAFRCIVMLYVKFPLKNITWPAVINVQEISNRSELWSVPNRPNHRVSSAPNVFSMRHRILQNCHSESIWVCTWYAPVGVIWCVSVQNWFIKYNLGHMFTNSFSSENAKSLSWVHTMRGTHHLV